MANPEHEKLERLFTAALSRESWAERDAFLEGACGDDADLRARLTDLLKVHGEVGAFLDAPPRDPTLTIATEPPRESTGTKIGRYKILQEIGEGGFGTVYMAEQEEPVRRAVALKIIKLGMDTKQVIARFEAERQALALMDHPNIARVLDAGATESGRPYFVMELVKGVTITGYCDENKLSTRERLELFLPVCHAVQHAHQKGIIHRDLKPNNVLVTLHDNQSVPKVIDFGIAKATSQRLTDKTLFTEFRQFLGTPQYMSPDQTEISGLDVDTRADIYSLGVLLYELLTGTTPFDEKVLRTASYEEIQRILREVDPPTPSARLQTLSRSHDGETIATLRQTEPAALSRVMRGDLDWIVMKAMEKDRKRRYQTANDLAADIERHLRHEPVVAGPPTAFYKLRKFIQRHRVAVMGGTIVGLAVVAGLSLATVGLVQATRARVREKAQRALAETSATDARQHALKSATTSDFLKEMLRSVDPSKALGREVTVRFILDEAALKIEEGSLAEQPEVEATVRMTLGETYDALGHYPAAETQLREAESLWRRCVGEEHPETLRTRRALARVLRVSGKFAAAEALLRRTVDIQRRALGEEHHDTLTTMHELALALGGPGRLAEAEAIHRQTLEIQSRVLGEEHADTLQSMGQLGAVCHQLGKSKEAETLLRRALKGCVGVLGEEHPSSTEVMNNFGLLLEEQRNYAQAEALLRRAYELERRILGPDHPRVLISVNSLLRVLRAQDKVADTHPLVAERVDRLRRAAERSPPNPRDLHAYAWELLNTEPNELRAPVTALSFAERAVELDGGRDVNMLETLALAYEMTGNLDRAIEVQRQAIGIARTGGPHNLTELEARLTEFQIRAGNFAGAVAELASRLGGTLTSDSDSDTSLVAQSEQLMREGNFEEAASVLRVCLAVREKELADGDWRIPETRSRLGAALSSGGHFEEAEQLLTKSYADLAGQRTVPAAHRQIAAERLVELYRSWDKPAKLKEWQQRVTEGLKGNPGAGSAPDRPPRETP